jgi:glycosyltransferase involved in cell wall biosynthesis
MKRVSYIFPVSHHYRAPFHERLRALLAEQDVDYTVVYCAPGEENRNKGDTIDIAWGHKVGVTALPGGLIYQHGLKQAMKSDLVIIQQENKLLLNYILTIASRIGVKKIAYFGHGRNFQSRDRDGRSERFKRFWATKVNWWFAYTEETRAHIRLLGFPNERITVFNNSVNTALMRQQLTASTEESRAVLAESIGLVGNNVGVFVGGVYPDKRMAFLIDAADRIRGEIPDFELIVVGGGSDLPLVSKLAQTRPWVHVMGPRFGQEKVELMALGHVFMMPGLMGLAILDAGTAGLAIATTAFPWHSPEIAYLEPGISGLKVADWEDPEAYAREVTALLLDRSALELMRQGARAMADRYSIEAMAENFASGVLKALRT